MSELPSISDIFNDDVTEQRKIIEKMDKAIFFQCPSGRAASPPLPPSVSSSASYGSLENLPKTNGPWAFALEANGLRITTT